MRKYLIGMLIVVATLCSCDAEFSPNAEWKDVPVVYCILDQDDDTTWARVERCYLGEDDIHKYGMISDSINYPEGSIVVSLHAYRDGGQVDSVSFRYKLVDRDSGDFVSKEQPMYFCYTKDRLKEDCTYKIKIHSTADGHLMAESEHVSLIRQTSENVYTKPSVPYGKFGFGTDGIFDMEWPALVNARIYMPMVRFYYAYVEEKDTTYLDFMCGTTRNTTAYYSRDVFLDELKSRLIDDADRAKVYTRQVDLYLTACSEELYAYKNTNVSVTDETEVMQPYSNINGGLGIIGSRRTHLYKRVGADESNERGRGLGDLIANLGINML